MYYNTYKTHAMATHHGGSGQPLDRDNDMTLEGQPIVDTDVEVQQDFHPKDIAPYEDVEHTNPTRLTVITKELDELHQRIQAEEGQPNESLHHIEQEVQHLSISLNSSTHTEPLGEVLKHYMNTLSLAQKQTNFTNSLLQDISIFTGHNTTLLKDWLVDIETAADLTTESRTKLAQAKSKGLILHFNHRSHHISGKFWEDIKDLLQLKICNSDIHTSICHFMEIQEKEKESLTAYFHHFKEKKLRDIILSNNTVTIGIFH